MEIRNGFKSEAGFNGLRTVLLSWLKVQILNWPIHWPIPQNPTELRLSRADS